MAQETLIAQLQVNMQNINTTVIVLDPGVIRRTLNGTVLTMKVSDPSGSINAAVMNPEFSEPWRSGDILRIKGANTNVFQNNLILNINRNSECKKNGEFMMNFSELPDVSTMPLPAGATTTEKRSHGGQDAAPIMNRNPQGGTSGPFQGGGGPKGRPSH